LLEELESLKYNDNNLKEFIEKCLEFKNGQKQLVEKINDFKEELIKLGVPPAFKVALKLISERNRILHRVH
jgi:uncharacterized protein YkvS